jgi:hypothetical protein
MESRGMEKKWFRPEARTMTEEYKKDQSQDKEDKCLPSSEKLTSLPLLFILKILLSNLENILVVEEQCILL